MAARSREPPQVDLSLFSTAECTRIWEVLQKDFQLRFQESQRLQRLKNQLAKAGQKASLLGRDPNFNENYCIVCFNSFIFLFNPKHKCFSCFCNACRSCSRYFSKRDQWLCRLCEDEKVLFAKQCPWFYNGKSKTFVVNGNQSVLPQETANLSSDPIADHMRLYLQGFVARYKQEDGTISPWGEEVEATIGQQSFASAPRTFRSQLQETELLKKITAHQVMRFQQKMSAVTADLQRFLRDNVPHDIPESGEDPSYDKKLANFRVAIANHLRTFSQTLYIAIEGHSSKTGETVQDIHRGVQEILQDEVESLVGYRVDIAFQLSNSRPEDDTVSTTSDDFGSPNAQGPTLHERLTDILLEKWLADHQSFLDDQQFIANDSYSERTLEQVLAKKSIDRFDFGEPPSDHLEFGMSSGEVDPDLLCTQTSAFRLEGSFSSGSSSNWLLKGRPVANCGDSLRNLQSSRRGDDGASQSIDDFSEDDKDAIFAINSTDGLIDRKASTSSLDFDAVYRQNLRLAADSVSAEPLTQAPDSHQQSARSEDSGVQVTSSPPQSRPELERRFSLGFARMDWSLSERSDPHFVAKTAEVRAEEGACAVIAVEVDGTQPIDIFWHRCSPKELQPLEEGPRVEFVTARDHPGKSSLLLWDLRMQDAGEYLATAVNEKGSSQQGFKVIVSARTQPPESPSFLQEICDEAVLPGDTARLHCKVQGNPLPRVIFQRRGIPLRDSDKLTIMRIGERSYSLAVHDVQPEDEGTYVCIASNCGGVARCTAHVTISSTGYRLIRRYVFTSANGQPGVDSSSTVGVRSEISRLSFREKQKPKNLFQDQIKPLTHTSEAKIQLSTTKSQERRRKTESPRAPPERVAQRSESKKKEIAFNPSIDMTEFELRAASDQPMVMDCGLKRVGSSHKRNFHVKRSPGGGEAKEKEDAEKRGKDENDARRRRMESRRREEDVDGEDRMEEKRARALNLAAPVVTTQEGKEMDSSKNKTTAFANRRTNVKNQHDTVADITTLIENGRLRPEFVPNMFASFRTRKFPSVSEIRDNFSRRSARGTYTPRDPALAPQKSHKPSETKSSSADAESVGAAKLNVTGRKL